MLPAYFQEKKVETVEVFMPRHVSWFIFSCADAVQKAQGRNLGDILEGVINPAAQMKDFAFVNRISIIKEIRVKSGWSLKDSVEALNYWIYHDKEEF